MFLLCHRAELKARPTDLVVQLSNPSLSGLAERTPFMEAARGSPFVAPGQAALSKPASGETPCVLVPHATLASLLLASGPGAGEARDSLASTDRKTHFKKLNTIPRFFLEELFM